MGRVKAIVKQQSDSDCSVACLSMVASALPHFDLNTVMLRELPYPVGYLLGSWEGQPDIHYAPSSDELAYVLNTYAGCQAGVLRSDSFYQTFLDPEMYSQWRFSDRLHYSKEQLQTLAQDKMALLVVRSNKVKDGFHLVLWDCDQLLDPDQSLPIDAPMIPNWDSYDVLEVILIWTLPQS